MVVANGGSGYVVGDTVTVSSFPAASFRATDVGSPILGVGTQTYIVASSGIGSVFVQDVYTAKISLCLTSCSNYNSQINTLVPQLNTLKSQRQILIDGVNNVFKLSKTPIPGSEHVFLNGMLQESGQNFDYILDGKNIIFNQAPIENMRIICSYRSK